MPYDNIKSLEKPGFHPLLKRYIFSKNQGGGVGGTGGGGEQGQIDPTSRFKVKRESSKY